MYMRLTAAILFPGIAQRNRPPGSGNSRDSSICERTYQTYQQQ